MKRGTHRWAALVFAYYWMFWAVGSYMVIERSAIRALASGLVFTLAVTAFQLWRRHRKASA
jgi:hypothetical protein